MSEPPGGRIDTPCQRLLHHVRFCMHGIRSQGRRGPLSVPGVRGGPEQNRARVLPDFRSKGSGRASQPRVLYGSLSGLQKAWQSAHHFPAPGTFSRSALPSVQSRRLFAGDEQASFIWVFGPPPRASRVGLSVRLGDPP